MLILLLVATTLAIRADEKQYFLNYVFDPYGFLYLDQMGYSQGKGVAEFNISYHGVMKNKDVQPHIYIGMLSHDKFYEFEQLRSCAEKEALLMYKERVPLNNTDISKTTIPINQSKEALINFYLFNCENIYEPRDGGYTLYVNVTWDLNFEGSHLSSKEDLLPYYYSIAWLIMGIVNFLTVRKYKKFQQKTPTYTWVIATGLLLWTAYSVKMGYFYFHSKSGDWLLLKIVFQVVKAVSQNLVATLLLSVGFGWTTNHLGAVKDTAVPVGGTLFVTSLLTIMFSHLIEDTSKNHQYDTISYSVLMIFKWVVAVVFLFGVCRSYTRSINVKTQNFLKEFGLLGTVYLISQPVLTLLVNNLVEVQYQNETLTIAADLVHLIGVMTLMNSVVSFTSDYAKLDYNHNTVFRNYDSLKQF